MYSLLQVIKIYPVEVVLAGDSSSFAIALSFKIIQDGFGGGEISSKGNLI